MKKLILLLFILASCSKEEITPDTDRCKLHFYPVREHKFTMYAQTYSENRPDTQLEVWSAAPQDNKYPTPGMFLKLTSNEIDSGTYYGKKLKDVFHINSDINYKYLWIQLRTVNPCGESEFKTILVRVGFGIQEL